MSHDWALGTALIDVVIGFTLCEGLLLARWHRRTGRGIAPVSLLPNLAAGLCLMLALRGALEHGVGSVTVLWLMAAGGAHAADLWRRWPREKPLAPLAA